jgi:prevent-host-death family protein
MPIIRPISDLRNKFREISELVHKNPEPIFITRDGRGDMVVMSMATWELQQAKAELHRLIDEAEADESSGDKGITLAQYRKKRQRR